MGNCSYLQRLGTTTPSFTHQLMFNLSRAAVSTLSRSYLKYDYTVIGVMHVPLYAGGAYLKETRLLTFAKMCQFRSSMFTKWDFCFVCVNRVVA